jgi:hypothetical protein
MSTTTPTPMISGNGVAEMEPVEILERTTQATLAAHSVRMRGKLRDEDGNRVTMDFRVQGKQATGFVEYGGEGHIEMIVTGSVFYFKGDKEFLTRALGRQGARQFAGLYLKASINDKRWADLAPMTSVAELIGTIPKPAEFDFANRGVPTYINELSAIPVGSPGTINLYVATEGKPYLLRISYVEEEDYIDLLEYEKPVTIRRPPSRLVVDVDEVS